MDMTRVGYVEAKEPKILKRSQVLEFIDEHINGVLADIQTEIGQDDGGVAGIYFNEDSFLNIADLLER